MANSVLKSERTIEVLYTKSCFLSFQTKKLKIMSIIQCHLGYASTVWFYSITQALKKKLQTTQNNLVRFVLNLYSKTHVGNE